MTYNSMGSPKTMGSWAGKRQPESRDRHHATPSLAPGHATRRPLQVSSSTKRNISQAIRLTNQHGKKTDPWRKTFPSSGENWRCCATVGNELEWPLKNTPLWFPSRESPFGSFPKPQFPIEPARAGGRNERCFRAWISERRPFAFNLRLVSGRGFHLGPGDFQRPIPSPPFNDGQATRRKAKKERDNTLYV